jgi:hypothetical protein
MAILEIQTGFQEGMHYLKKVTSGVLLHLGYNGVKFLCLVCYAWDGLFGIKFCVLFTMLGAFPLIYNISSYHIQRACLLCIIVGIPIMVCLC